MPLSSSGDAGGLYRRLQVSPQATGEEIARAYRRMAHSAHPDTNPGDPEAARRFHEITEAYQVLSDPYRRAAYDARHTFCSSVSPGVRGAAAAKAPLQPVLARRFAGPGTATGAGTGAYPTAIGVAWTGPLIAGSSGLAMLVPGPVRVESVPRESVSRETSRPVRGAPIWWLEQWLRGLW